MRVITQVCCVVRIIFIRLLFEGARIRGYHRQRTRLLARDEIPNIIHFWLALVQLFLLFLSFYYQFFFKNDLFFGPVSLCVPSSSILLLDQLLLTSFFSYLRDTLIQLYRHFTGIVVVHRWELSRCSWYQARCTW